METDTNTHETNHATTRPETVPSGADAADRQQPGDLASPDHSVWVGLGYDDAHAARAWLGALGFAEGIVVDGDAPGEIRHSEMIWPEGGRVMVSSLTAQDPEIGPARGSATVYVVVDEPDVVWDRAQRLGAPVLRPLADTDYGSRGFTVADPEGTSWSFGTYAG